MGKGNTIIRDYDGEPVTTYYTDISANFEEEKKEMINQERESLNDELRALGSFGEKRRAVIQAYKQGRLLDPSDEDVW